MAGQYFLNLTSCSRMAAPARVSSKFQVPSFEFQVRGVNLKPGTCNLKLR